MAQKPGGFPCLKILNVNIIGEPIINVLDKLIDDCPTRLESLNFTIYQANESIWNETQVFFR
jgi:hypothetical protein